MSEKKARKNPDAGLKDRAAVARLYCEGVEQIVIAERLSITQQMVSYHLQQLRKDWLKSSAMDFDKRQAEELARIDHMELTYWQAWHDSRKPKQMTLTEKIQGTRRPRLLKFDKGKDKPEIPFEDDSRLKAQQRTEERDGNPAYLDGVQWCIEQRCKIRGHYAATKNEHTGKDGSPLLFIPPDKPFKQMTDEELDVYIEQAQSRQRGSVPRAGNKGKRK